MFVLLNDQFTNMNYFKTVNSNQISNLISQKEEVTIYFYKNNCQPCAVQKDILNSLVKNNEYEIYGVNIESYDGKSYDIIRKYNIKYTPTFIKYKLGVYSERKEGLNDAFLQGGCQTPRCDSDRRAAAAGSVRHGHAGDPDQLRHAHLPA